MVVSVVVLLLFEIESHINHWTRLSHKMSPISMGRHRIHVLKGLYVTEICSNFENVNGCIQITILIPQPFD